MALTAEEGTQTAVVGTEHTLNTTDPETADCILQVWIDASNMQVGDYLELRIYEKVKSAGTQRLLWWSELANAQSELYASPSVHVRNGWKVTLKQTLGTARSYDWSLRKVA